MEIEVKGRKPKPVALKRLHGNPGKRPLPANELEPPGAPAGWTPPPHVIGEARTEWRRTVPLLAVCGVLTRIDRAALAAYCVAYSHWVDAEHEIAKTGAVVKRKNGTIAQNPFLIISRQQVEIMLRYLSEFGMTPASRARMGGFSAPLTPGGNDDDDGLPAAAGKFRGLIGRPRPN